MMRSLLLVDDDPQFRKLATAVLETRGHRVVQAGSGAEANAALDRRRPDLIIVDGLLPDTDGLRWIRGLRGRGDETKVVFVSAFWRDPGSIATLEDLGVAAVLYKPVAPAALGEQVDAVLGADAPRVQHDRSLLDDLREEYAAALPGKNAAIASAVDAYLRDPADVPLAQEARLRAHRLHGTAGSYGFKDAGDAAGKLERLLDEAMAGGSVAHATWLAALVSLRTRRSGEAAQPSRPGPSFAANVVTLLVDDDSDFLAHAVEAGRQRGIQVLPARTTAEALDLARQHPLDVALLDIMLNEERSFELARQLRALPGCEDVPVAFVTAYPEVANRVAAAHAGASLFLPKPLPSDVFCAAVHQLAGLAHRGRPRLLIVDDDPDFRAAAARLAHHAGMDVDLLADPTRVLDELERVQPDVLLVDENMPGLAGLDVCRVIRNMPRWLDLPILLCSGENEWDTRLAAFRAGADDYVQKPVMPEELLARLHVRIDRSRLLRERSDRDTLTGLPVRRVFLERLAERAAEARRHQRPLSVCLIDLDHFKQINDTRGHMAGDRVLAALGHLLLRSFRAEDLRGRWGGEELVLAFPGEDPATAAGVVERVLAELAAIEFVDDHGRKFHATFSGGIASIPPDGTEVDPVLAAADRRLYAAKQAGRARVVWQDS